MRRPVSAIVPCSALAILLIVLAGQAQTSDIRVPPAKSPCDNATQAPGPPSAACVVERRVASIRAVRDVLRQEASTGLPPGLSAADSAEARRYVAWLTMWADRLDALAMQGDYSIGKGGRGASGGDLDSQAQFFQATKQMQERQLSFNVQYLAVPKQMENQHRQFTMVSNVLKTKHDVVKSAISSINNVR